MESSPPATATPRFRQMARRLMADTESRQESGLDVSRRHGRQFNDPTVHARDCHGRRRLGPRIGGDQTPQSVALDWLNEIAEPGLRDLNVEFRGLKVAALYPERLPNLAAGTQQILVGRYLPSGQGSSRAKSSSLASGAETVRYAAKIDLKDAEAGIRLFRDCGPANELDYLLAQGQSAAVRDKIIALSEEFHIMTPYTSLLVLETDADRERFGVKRRFDMRDGERFFAEGEANANFELSQQQMKRAGDWRIGLRRQILAQLSTLGRDSQCFNSR